MLTFKNNISFQDIIDNPKELETYSNTLQNTYVALKKNKAHIRTIFSEMIIKAMQELTKRKPEVLQKKSSVRTFTNVRR